MVTLSSGAWGKLSLKYVQDLWKQLADEFDLPFQTAVLDSVLSGSVIITWLVPHDVAANIITSPHKFTPFFEKYDILRLSVALDA